ncbi:hypothetical protein ACFQ7F_30020 [Streptomyces sp. NPDC056486]|uniref:hypothetical protein n=1 Tax=Streptomyces sp. NPDC056486 TaxID=3345835 RepID=UPI003683CC40
MPSHHLPLLLTAYQHRFGRDAKAMSRHLIDDVAVGWEELGTDLLDDAPPALVAALTGGEHWPSRTLDHLITPDGSPPVRMAVTNATADALDLQWGYVLHTEGCLRTTAVSHTACWSDVSNALVGCSAPCPLRTVGGHGAGVLLQ